MKTVDPVAEQVRDTPVWRNVTVQQQRPRFVGRAEADVAVIGGGLTGLSAALHLTRSRPEWSIVLIEASRIGAGASGRSTGIVGPGVGSGIGSLLRRFGPRVARQAFRYSQDAVDTLVKLAQDERIECDLTPGAHLICAATSAQAARLARDQRMFARLGLAVTPVNREELARRAGHDIYRFALEYQPVVLVNPLKLSLGLADAASRSGVRVTEDSRVTSITAEPGGVRVEVGAQGRIRARMAVIATDGYTPPFLPYGTRVFPVRTHVLATRPLSMGERARLGWTSGDAVIDQRMFFSYYRLDAEGRLLFGGGPVLNPAAGPLASEHVWRRLERELRSLFPVLRDIPIEFRWSGLTSATLDELPVVGEVPGKPGIFFAGAWRGHGLALSVASGAWLADRMAHGSADIELPWHRSRTGNPPLGSLRTPAVASYVRVFDTFDRIGGLADRMRTERHPAGTRAGLYPH
jgi:glycine/D-amino acid oxidase-like deaminating enzyme